jgi:hypothetical protein
VKYFKQLGLWFLPEVAEASSSEEESNGRQAVQKQVVASTPQQQCYDFQGLNQIIAKQPSSDRSDIQKNKIFETCCILGNYWEKRNEKHVKIE